MSLFGFSFQYKVRHFSVWILFRSEGSIEKTEKDINTCFYRLNYLACKRGMKFILFRNETQLQVVYQKCVSRKKQTILQEKGSSFAKLANHVINLSKLLDMLESPRWMIETRQRRARLGWGLGWGGGGGFPWAFRVPVYPYASQGQKEQTRQWAVKKEQRLR